MSIRSEGRLPKPDLAVIVDTEREKQSTWMGTQPCQFDYFTAEGAAAEFPSQLRVSYEPLPHGRFDGWIKVADVPGGKCGVNTGWTLPRHNYQAKSVWVFPLCESARREVMEKAAKLQKPKEPV